MQIRGTFVLKAACAAVAVGAFAPAIAADGADVYEREVAGEANKLSADDVSDGQLESFLEAAREVKTIRSDSVEKIESDGPDAQKEAQEQMAEAIEDSGLGIQEYRELGFLVEDDDDVRGRLNEVVASAGSGD